MPLGYSVLGRGRHRGCGDDRQSRWDVIERRRSELATLVEDLAAERAQDRVGSTVAVLIEELDEEGNGIGRAAHQGLEDGDVLVRSARRLSIGAAIWRQSYRCIGGGSSSGGGGGEFAASSCPDDPPNAAWLCCTGKPPIRTWLAPKPDPVADPRPGHGYGMCPTR